MAPGGDHTSGMSSAAASREDGLPASSGYRAVDSSPRSELRTLESSSRRFGGPSQMNCRQKMLVAGIICVLVLGMAALGGMLGVELGKRALKHKRFAFGSAEQPAAQQIVAPPSEDQVEARNQKQAPLEEAPLFLPDTPTSTSTASTASTARATVPTTHDKETQPPTTTERTTTQEETTSTTRVKRHSEKTSKTTLIPSTTGTTTTTTQATTKTSTHSTTTTLPETTTTHYYPTLFCYSIMRAHGHELSLVRTQLARGVSVFACEAWRVYSDKRTWLTPGPPVRLDTSVLEIGLEAESGVKEHILNTEIFLQAWKQAHEEGLIQRHEWSVKVDPDAVFFPSRLRQRLSKSIKAAGARVYFLNCKLGFELYGALEVFSKRAMEDFFDGLDLCKRDLPWTTYGEDLFMRRCLDLLGVEHIRDYGMLSDEYCAVKPFPCVGDSAAFHPFKASETYFKCVEEARNAEKEHRLLQ